MQELLLHIGALLNEEIRNVMAVAGGDISKAFKIETVQHSYFLKVNRSSNALQMFESEKKGLETIASTQTISVPTIHHCGVHWATGFVEDWLHGLVN